MGNQIIEVDLERSKHGRKYYIVKLACCGEIVSKRSEGINKQCIKCGNKAHSKHNMEKTVEYQAWRSMKKRCYQLSGQMYKNYGGRGIVVCDRWRDSFVNFFQDMGYRPSNNHSLDRIDVNGNYEPSNCKWSDKIEQANNRRNSKFITYQGITRTIWDWNRHLKLNIAPETLSERIKAWGVERAFTTPKMKRKDTISGN